MNFLGHCLFSEPTPDALVGSLWPDFARRPAPDAVSDRFLRHFDRHQHIDKLTDHHELLADVREALRPVFRKTTPVVIDMMLDHHLARGWSNYHEQPLEDFAQTTYQQLQAFNDIDLPDRFEKTVYWMHHHNWFVSYRQPEGILRALEGMSRRLRFNNPMVEHRLQAVEASQHFEQELHAFICFLFEEFDRN